MFVFGVDDCVKCAPRYKEMISAALRAISHQVVILLYDLDLLVFFQTLSAHPANEFGGLFKFAPGVVLHVMHLWNITCESQTDTVLDCFLCSSQISDEVYLGHDDQEW